MTTFKIKMDAAERERRALEPDQRAADRKRQAASFMDAQRAKDRETSARLAKLRELRLAAAPAVVEAIAPKKAVKARRKVALTPS